MTDQTRAATAAADAAAVTAALARLSDHAVSEPELGPHLEVLDALTADGGPLAALGALFARVSDALIDYEHEEIDRAAERVGDAADAVATAAENLTIALRLLRPLEG